MKRSSAIKVTSTVIAGFMSVVASSVGVTVATKLVQPTTVGKKVANILLASAATGYGLRGMSNVVLKATGKLVEKTGETA